MHTTVVSITDFLERRSWPDLDAPNLDHILDVLITSEEMRELLAAFVQGDAFSDEFSARFAAAGAVAALPPARMLRGALNLPLRRFFALLANTFTSFEPAAEWAQFADRIANSLRFRDVRLVDFATKRLRAADARAFYAGYAAGVERTHPHAIYPTSEYRESSGSVTHTGDDQTIQAVMRVSTFSTIRVVDRSLEVATPVLRDLYAALGRCVALVDANVEALYGDQLDAYFAHHRIVLHKRVYRADESDKTIHTVERMLGDFKTLGVARNEPVLIVGGGVLADTGGLACALYGRNTPYVMLATSIVTGIDAGPSPRTCCDGFGYKNLVGAYHPPIVSITDRHFFKTLADGWLRHGIAEIIKMAAVNDAPLFAMLEAARGRLIETRFGTIDCIADDPIATLSQRILGSALRSYVAAEYTNLYETHQCRPHAYGHTWSPGFEIEAGLLHGHAVSICMGFGAYLSFRLGRLDAATFHRILALLDGYGLSLWHDILERKDTIWKSQQAVIQKRGHNLVAPVPSGSIGQCGYLNELSRRDLFAALDEYQAICARYPRSGHGIDAHCDDVTLDGSLPRSPALSA